MFERFSSYLLRLKIPSGRNPAQQCLIENVTWNELETKY